MLEDEETEAADLSKLNDLRDKMERTQDILDLDDQFALSLDDPGSTVHTADCDEPNASISDGFAEYRGDCRLRHLTLKGSCPTRWNSTQTMIESVSDLQKSVNNCLKKVGCIDLCFSSGKVSQLMILKQFLKKFEAFTDVFSTNMRVLLMVPLTKLQIRCICQTHVDDDDAIGSLKFHTLQSLDNRLPENDFMKLSQLLDPMTKAVHPQTDALCLLQKALHLAIQKGILSTHEPRNDRATDATAAACVVGSNQHHVEPHPQSAESSTAADSNNDMADDRKVTGIYVISVKNLASF